MDEWRERLAGIDDDYLIGISNKGIVKRAYKDMEEGRLMEEGYLLPWKRRIPWKEPLPGLARWGKRLW